MAQPITCDVHNRSHLADVMVSQLANGETFAACADGFLEYCRAMVEQLDQPERDATDAEALARLDAAEPNPGFPTSGVSTDAAGPPPEPPTSDGDAPEPPEATSDTTPTRNGRQRGSTGRTEDAETVGTAD